MANDLISRQAAIDVVKGIDSYFVKYIEELPSAEPYTDEEIQKMQDMEQAQLEKAFELGREDAKAEIVRCKDCKWWTKQKDSIQGRCDLMQMYPTGEWFCGNAQERRTDD